MLFRLEKKFNFYLRKVAPLPWGGQQLVGNKDWDPFYAQSLCVPLNTKCLHEAFEGLSVRFHLTSFRPAIAPACQANMSLRVKQAIKRTPVSTEFLFKYMYMVFTLDPNCFFCELFRAILFQQYRRFLFNFRHKLYA